MKYRLKFISKNNPDNTGYFVRKLKVGFKACSLQWPEVARVMTKKTVEEVMNFLQEQGEFDYYDFIIEEVGTNNFVRWTV